MKKPLMKDENKNQRKNQRKSAGKFIFNLLIFTRK